MRFKWWLFDNFVWVGLAIGAVIVGFLYWRDWPIELAIAGLGSVLGYFHFGQRQRLAEARLFRDLFTELNVRYDKMNDELSAAFKAERLDAQLEKRLVDYFNLCAEEFLYYQRGYIYPTVWQAWCRGMLQYLRINAVRKLWESEVKTGSYYGLTMKEIEDSAE
jgi:hypothetical protein